MLRLANTAVASGKLERNPIRSITGAQRSDSGTNNWTSLDASDLCGRPVVRCGGGDRNGSSFEDIVPCKIDAIQKSSPRDSRESEDHDEWSVNHL